MRYSCRANNYSGFVKHVAFILLTHIYFEFRAKVIDVIRGKSYENQYFVNRMDMRSASGRAVPDAWFAIKSPRKIKG